MKPENVFLSGAFDISGKYCLYEDQVKSALIGTVLVEAFSYRENEVMSSKYKDEELHVIFYKNGKGKCNICERPLKFEHYGEDHKGKPGNWEVDHDWPRAKCGDDDISNLMPAHPHCNRSKQDDIKR